MRIPPFPILYGLAFLVALNINAVHTLVRIALWACTGRWFGLPASRIVERSGEDWRIVDRFLWWPLWREDRRGWEWLARRQVMDYYDWRGGSEGGMVWIPQYVLVSNPDQEATNQAA